MPSQLYNRHTNENTQVRETSNNLTPEPFRWTAESLLALQEVRILLGYVQCAAT